MTFCTDKDNPPNICRQLSRWLVQGCGTGPQNLEILRNLGIRTSFRCVSLVWFLNFFRFCGQFHDGCLILISSVIKKIKGSYFFKHSVVFGFAQQIQKLWVLPRWLCFFQNFQGSFATRPNCLCCLTDEVIDDVINFTLDVHEKRFYQHAECIEISASGGFVPSHSPQPACEWVVCACTLQWPFPRRPLPRPQNLVLDPPLIL